MSFTWQLENNSITRCINVTDHGWQYYLLTGFENTGARLDRVEVLSGTHLAFRVMVNGSCYLYWSVKEENGW